MYGQHNSLGVEIKIAMVLLIMVIVFFISNELFVPLFSIPQSGMMRGTGRLTVDYLGLNIASLLASLIAGAIAAYYLELAKDFSGNPRHTEAKKEPLENPKPIDRSKEYSAVRAALLKGLSNDEQQLYQEIEKAGEITQDSLRIRLGWSKSKLSTIASFLDRQGMIQRKRFGKTYKLFVQDPQSIF